MDMDYCEVDIFPTANDAARYPNFSATIRIHNNKTWGLVRQTGTSLPDCGTWESSGWVRPYSRIDLFTYKSGPKTPVGQLNALSFPPNLGTSDTAEIVHNGGSIHAGWMMSKTDWERFWSLFAAAGCNYRTPWKIYSSWGVSGSKSFGKVTLQEDTGGIFIEHRNTQEKYHLLFKAFGANFGVGLPISISGSTPDFWSQGIGYVYSAQQQFQYIHASSFVAPCAILQPSIALVGGYSVTAFLFGASHRFTDWMTKIKSNPYLWSGEDFLGLDYQAMGLLEGTSLGIQAGAGVAVQLGFVIAASKIQ